MQSATERFFSIPELIVMLAKKLDYKGISRLMRTSRCMHELCTPALFLRVSAVYQPKAHNLFASEDSILALSKNIHHVRELALGLLDVVYYINCVFAYQKHYSQTTGQPPSRPPWLAPPDPLRCRVFPLSPMTLLTKLDVDITVDVGLEKCLYHLRSYKDPRANATKVYWTLRLNPYLTHVTITGLAFKDTRDVRLLTTSIFGLASLQHLSVCGVFRTQSALRMGPNIFFSCPSSLQTLTLKLSEFFGFWHGASTHDYYRLPPGSMDSWEKEDELCGLMTTPHRQEPLSNLTSLDLKCMEEAFSEQDFLSILQHCPNLCDIKIPDIRDVNDKCQLAKVIAGSCPKLTNLEYRDHCEEGTDGLLMTRIMGALPPQQVKSLICGNRPFNVNGPDAVTIFLMHSSTLQTLSLGRCEDVPSKAIQIVLVECRGLQIFETRWAGSRSDLCIDLEDAIKFPWACTRVRTLRLTVAVPDDPLYRHTGEEPYYMRPPPTALSAAEEDQFGQLEAFYRQIGELVEIQSLDLSVTFYDPQGVRPLNFNTRTNTFPGMLSTGNHRSGRPGYLHHLGGLTKLRELAGSVSAETGETKVTMGLIEAWWMNEHWPVLQSARFFQFKSNITDTFKWLQNQRDASNPLRLSCN